MLIKDIKINPNNPRHIKNEKFEKLCKSIEDFPKMLELRPIVIDENNMVLGGNMRLQALIELGYKNIDDSWIIKESQLSEKQKSEFIIKDNVGYGAWDWDILANEWDIEDLEEWGLDVPNLSDEKTDEFEKEINEITDKNCKMPIVPKFFENHECFLIPVHNEIDEMFIRDIFGLNDNFVSDSEDGKERKTNVISVETIRKSHV